MTARTGRPVGATRRVAAYLGRDRRRLTLLCLAALGMALVSAAGPVLIAQGPGLGLRSASGGLALAVGVLLIGVVVWALNRVRIYLTKCLVADAVLAMRLDALRSALGQDLEFYDRNDRSSITSRVTNDLESFGESTFNLLELLQQLLVVVLLIPLMFVLEWRLTLATLAGGFLIALTTRRFGRVTRRRAGRAAAATAALTTSVAESTSGLATVRAFGCEKPLVEAAAKHNTRLFEANRRADFYAALLQPSLAVLTGLITTLLVFAGGMMVEQAVLTAPAWYLFVLATDRVAWLLASTGSLDGQAQTALAASERIFELIDAAREDDPPGAEPLAGRGAVRVEGLRLTYTSGNEALRGVTLDVPAGCHLGLVGPSGSGKSTLLKVLARMQPPTDGEVLLDGRPLSDAPEEELRRGVAYVPQRPQLFDGTIADNLRMAVPELTDGELTRLVADAGLTSWLAAFPQGMRTPVGPGGEALSHGQRQVVCLLRALAKRPFLVLLDEPTANVDKATDEHLQQALRSLLDGVTCVVIAHRLNTVRDADRIAVLREGRITETGTHDELLAAGGEYAALHEDFAYASADDRTSVTGGGA
ncbi:ABC transporter ATP-binding protein [Streptomyces sp. NBRC 109706]|uniref:ABC transporter ATP-binding protein n=1 Tax=Streptomyces sp. NBRC 109706 TaxID=1550035 RepID=UPI00078332A1|nr:ABC transporter ATP-binding protein [Streptomyces sp. NBRC 109706]